MKKATISQIKNQLSAYLRDVEAGETILIVNRERPVARLVSVRTSSVARDDERVRALARAGVIRAALEPPDAALVDVVLAPAPEGSDLLGAVLEERETGW
jgi:prevent-host-death family protein